MLFVASSTGGFAMQYIHLLSGLTGFRNSTTTIEVAQSGREVYLLHGEPERGEAPSCPECGQKMHIHGSRITMLRHLCFGSRLSAVSFEKRRIAVLAAAIRRRRTFPSRRTVTISPVSCCSSQGIFWPTGLPTRRYLN